MGGFFNVSLLMIPMDFGSISYFSIFTFLTKDITMSLKIASAFASLTVTHNGVYAPNIEDFKNIISDYL